MKEERASKGTRRGRMKRYTKVSTTMTGLAARLAGQKYLGLEIDRPEHARQLMESLGALKGPLLKVAQLLATIPNALPREYAAELQKLQSQAPPMGPAFVRRRMMSELGREWKDKFTSFDETATAAASLGQVHRATTLDGQDVACKLQYPDMNSAVEADLKQLGVFLKLFEKYDRSVNTAEIHAEIVDRLREELDYRLEARHTKLYAHMLRDEKHVHVAQVADDLSTDRLLTSTWLQGAPVLNYVDAPQQDRNTIALNMFRAWYVPLYFYGVIHGDPHLGNYSVREENLDLNLLDFGCVRIFPTAFVEGVITLYHALMEDDRDKSVAAYESWGFKNLNNEIIDILNTWAGFLYGPVLDNKKRRIGDIPENAVYGRETAQQVHQALKQAGGVTVPRPFVFMDRAALGLGSVFLHLRAEINWYRLFNEMIEGFDAKTLHQRQKKALDLFGLKQTP